MSRFTTMILIRQYKLNNYSYTYTNCVVYGLANSASVEMCACACKINIIARTRSTQELISITIQAIAECEIFFRDTCSFFALTTLWLLHSV